MPVDSLIWPQSYPRVMGYQKKHVVYNNCQKQRLRLVVQRAHIGHDFESNRRISNINGDRNIVR